MIENFIQKGSKILWQTFDEEGTPPEAAIVVQPYSDCIQISQSGNEIRLNYHHAIELIKILRTIKPIT